MQSFRKDVLVLMLELKLSSITIEARQQLAAELGLPEIGTASPGTRTIADVMAIDWLEQCLADQMIVWRKVKTPPTQTAKTPTYAASGGVTKKSNMQVKAELLREMPAKYCEQYSTMLDFYRGRPIAWVDAMEDQEEADEEGK